MNEQLQPCRCGEIGEIYFQTPSFTRFGYRVGLVECNICGEVVSFVSKCMDHAEFCIDAAAAWNGRNELDQLRQRLAEAEAELAECREILNAELDRDVESKITVRNLVVIAVNSLQRERAARQAAEQDARRMDWLEAHPNELRFEPFLRSGQAWACCPSTKIGNDGRPHSYVDRFATARAAIDASGEGHVK